jgi:small GTP-binding protein
MHSRSLTNGLFLLIALAALGVLLVWVPPQVMAQYDKVKDLGPWWVAGYFGIIGTGAAILLGVVGYFFYSLWSATRKKNERRERQAKNPSELSSGEKQKEVAENLAATEDLRQDAAISDEVKRELTQLKSRVEEKQESQRLEIVAFGTVSSGKSSLLNALAGRDAFQTDPRGGTTIQRQEIPWPGTDKVSLVDTPGLGEVDGADHVVIAADSARDADIVLMVVDGPLRESEFRLLSRLGEMEKRVIVCLNKADWYEPEDQAKLLGQIAGQVQEFVSREGLVAVRSQAVTRQRTRVLAGGEEIEETVTEPADIAPLAKRMLEVVRRDGRDLLLANLLLRSRGLVEESRRRVQEALDKRAWEIVDRYTWGAGAAAAISPVPILDLIAGSAITAKMVVDLAKVYRQPIDINSAITLLAQLGKNLVAILGVNLAAPAIVTAVASLLKGTLPIAGQIAGGALQGLVQALVTRWIGGIFVEYFKTEMHLPSEGLSNLARREWQKLTSPAELLKFVQEAREKLKTRM